MLSWKQIRDDLYIIGSLKSGSFGSVHAAHDKAGRTYSVKFLEEQSTKIKHHFLFFKSPKPCKEGKILAKLQKIPGIPKLYYYGKNPVSNSYMIITELLGSDLKLEFIKRKAFSSDYIAKIGVKLIEILEAIHKKNIIHRDIKPENILLSQDKADEFYLVDFGLSKTITTRKKNKIQKFIGSTSFAASACHFGQNFEKKNDLESLGYVLLYIIQGFLPWQDIEDENFDEKIKKIGERKQKFLEKELDSIPQSMASFFQYLQPLKSSHKIDYNYLKELMIKLNKDLIYRQEKSICLSNVSLNNDYTLSFESHNEGKDFIYFFL